MKYFYWSVLSTVFFTICLLGCSDDDPTEENQCTEKPELSIEASPTEIDKATGAITIIQQGTNEDLMYSLNDTLYQRLAEFSSLAAGSFTLFVKTEDGCVFSYPFELGEKPFLQISSHENGDTVFIPFALGYELKNIELAEGGPSIQLLVDGQEKGNTTNSSSIEVGTELLEGLHDFKLQLIDKNQEMLEQKSEIRLFVADSSHQVTVLEGTGSGTYKLGETVEIEANAPATGKEFKVWVGDIAFITDTSASKTTLTMPIHDVEVTATYQETLYKLEVENGTGSGDYVYNTRVNITANAAPNGKVFSTWSGDVSYIGSANEANTTVTMPAQNISLNAEYKDAPTPTLYTLTIENGTGDGDYEEGANVNISANNPPSGQTFASWTGDISYLTNASASSTSVTMPAKDITITATYKNNSTEVSYQLDIVPLFNAKCIDSCHGPNDNSIDLTDYSVVKKSAQDIKTFSLSGYMPTIGSLTEEEKQLIADWVDQGAKNN